MCTVAFWGAEGSTRAGSPLGEVSHVARASWLILTILAGDPEVGAFVGSYAPLKLWHWYEMLTGCDLPCSRIAKPKEAEVNSILHSQWVFSQRSVARSQWVFSQWIELSNRVRMLFPPTYAVHELVAPCEGYVPSK